MNPGPPRRQRGPAPPKAPAVLVAIVAFACGPGDAPPGEDPGAASRTVAAEPGRAPFAMGGAFFDSPDEAARRALELVAEGDAESLAQLALGAADFREAVYPRLPASRPERNTSAEFLWRTLHQRSRNSLAYTLNRHGGRRYALIAVDFVGQTTDYGPFQVHRDTVLTVHAPDGERGTLRIFGSMLEQDGRYQIFSFVTD